MASNGCLGDKGGKNLTGRPVFGSGRLFAYRHWYGLADSDLCHLREIKRGGRRKDRLLLLRATG